jgi:peptidyl-prolyl cis-trans isomerase C
MTMSARRSVITVLTLLTTGVGCGEEAPTRRGVALSPTDVKGDQVVARINGAPILRSDLELQMRRGQRRQAALTALIRQEVLAQEAQRRGFDRDPRVLREQERAMANLLIRREFRSHFTKKQVPRELIEAAYKLNHDRYVHEELVRVSHIVALASDKHGAEHHRKARSLAHRVHRIAVSGPLSAKEFKEIGALVNKDDATVEVRAEGPYLSPRPPARLVPAFLNAAFKLSKPGEISPILQTSYGYHVIYLEAKIPPRNDPLDRVEDEIREKVFKQARTQAFDRWAEQLEHAHGAMLKGGTTAARGGSTR